MAVKQGLLALIAERPKYGYELKTQFESATGGVWKLNVGQVYTTLDRLERDGFVSMTTDDNPDDNPDGPQKRYELTAAGREELGAWWEAVPVDEAPPRDELMVKVLIAIEHDRDTALAVITRQRTALYVILQQRRRELRRRIVIGDGPKTLAADLVADALVVRAEADLRWLDRCETEILNAPADAFAPTEQSG